jgi:hypothetical protein
MPSIPAPPEVSSELATSRSLCNLYILCTLRLWDRLASQPSEKVLRGKLRHVIAGLHRRRRGVRDDDAIRHFDQQVICRKRFGISHVERRGEDRAVAQGVDERVGIHDRAAGSIHQDGGWLHAIELVRGDEMLRICCQCDVEGHVVGFCEKLLERDVAHLMFTRECGIFEWVEREDAHVESASPFGDLLADPSQSHDTDRGAADLATEQEEGTPGLPLAITDVLHRLRNTTRRGEQQSPGVIGRCVGQHVGRIADKHAALRGSGDVDVVIADREIRDYAQIRMSVEHGPIDVIREQSNGAVASFQQHVELVRRRRKLPIPELDLGRLPQ